MQTIFSSLIIRHHIENIIYDKNGLIGRWFLKPILYILSLLYLFVINVRMSLYRHGFLRSTSLPCRVISLGNITAGGTGKTPMAVWLGEFLRRRNFKVAILSRGYRGLARKEVNTVSDGHNVLLSSKEAGDEPYLMARRLKEVAVLTGKNRLKVGEFAVDRFGTDIIILDDGYQHARLHRGLDLVLLDATNPFGNGHLLPRGPLREPIGNLKRAHALILTRCDQANNMEKIIHYLQLNFPKVPVFRSVHRPYKVHTIGEDDILDPYALSGRKTLAFSGIANPKAFLGMLTDMGINVVRFKEYPDHYDYSDRDLCQIQGEAVSLGAETIITTEKDVVRIEGWPEGLPLSYISLNAEFLDDTFETFLSGYLNKEQNTKSQIRNPKQYHIAKSK